MPGVRRRLALELHSTSSGASMPLKRHLGAGYALRVILVHFEELIIGQTECPLCARSGRSGLFL